MKARSKPCATSESSPRSAGSKACASTPRFFSAARTIAPLLSDTGRSADLPPMRTATLPKWLMPPPPAGIALEAAGLDEPRGVVARRVAEHRPGVRQVERLRFDASRQQSGDA